MFEVEDLSFENLGLIPELLKAIKEEGYTKPTPIQVQSIPFVLKGKDLLGCAQTGTGKTAAFALPILQIIKQAKTDHARSAKPKIQVLILTPTRELAIQIGESFRVYGRYTGLKYVTIFGGVGQRPQEDALRRFPEVLVATPGRLLDLMNQGFVDLRQLQIFVLDEADRMLDMGFIHDVKRVIKEIPQKRQTLFFSATMPKDIQDLANSILTQPIKVSVTPVSSTAKTVRQEVYFIDRGNKRHLLIDLLKTPELNRVLVFTRTKFGANKITEHIVKNGMRAEAIHGNKSQSARQKALANFKSGYTQVLVASDLAARGIDVDGISHVINYDIPNIAETYVHRIGRTGRAGSEGVAISFCEPVEEKYLKDIEQLTKHEIPVVEEHAYPSSGIMLDDPCKRQPSGNRGGGRGKPGGHRGKPKFQRKR